jgi:dienelactone hydrolase
MAHDLAAVSVRLSASDLPPVRRQAGFSRRFAAIGGALIVVLAAGAGWLYYRSERRHWAREQAIPQIRKDFDESRSLAAFSLLNDAQQLLPGDPNLAALFAKKTSMVSIDSMPQGATVEIQDYVAPDTPWLRAGVTPIRDLRLPNGYFRWRVSKAGSGELLLAPSTRKKMTFDLQAQKSAPAGMNFVNGGAWGDMIAFVGWVGPYELPPYYIDRTEVTNRDFQKFVDSGGYAKSEYWREKFVRDGRALAWDEAMTLLRDRSGRAGPSTWEGGHYPPGQDDYPVSGVSWYEASAYAAYAGKSLPVFTQWFRAAPTQTSVFVVPQSNISRNAIAPVGKYGGVGPFGTVDMIGNVREWIANSDDNHSRFILGGAWSSLPYLSSDAESLPPFDRSPANGFRCVRNTAPLSAQVAAPITTQSRDFDHYKPASDDVFRAYEAMYAYDRTPLDVESEGVVERTADWRKEKITFNAAYGGERVTAYLFLPMKIEPPFQTVVFFPSARVLYLDNSKSLGDLEFFDYIIQSGRAVLYPVYKGTYERQDTLALPGTPADGDLRIKRYKDLARSLDYLKTRRDIDSNKLAYLGVSMGAAGGVIYSTLEQDAFRTAIFLDGGYFLNKTRPGGDQADFAPRFKKPVLMVNGRYDFTFPLVKSQEPLFRTLGTNAAEKRHVVLNTSHDVSAKKPTSCKQSSPGSTNTSAGSTERLRREERRSGDGCDADP